MEQNLILGGGKNLCCPVQQWNSTSLSSEWYCREKLSITPNYITCTEWFLSVTHGLRNMFWNKPFRMRLIISTSSFVIVAPQNTHGPLHRAFGTKTVAFTVVSVIWWQHKSQIIAFRMVLTITEQWLTHVSSAVVVILTNSVVHQQPGPYNTVYGFTHRSQFALTCARLSVRNP